MICKPLKLKNMKRKLIYTSLFCLLTNYLFAQLKVRETGQIMIGTPMEIWSGGYPPLDNHNYTQCIIYGPHGDWRAGSRLAFGDFQEKFCLNVLIGEYTEEDSDQLWLHGKNGIYLTSNPTADNVWGYYDVNLGNYFQFNCDVRSTGVFVASDSAFKENITTISNTLSNLKKLNAVSYKLKYDKEVKRSQSPLKSSGVSNSGGKESKDLETFAKFNRAIENQPDRFGFIAQQVQKVYPQLVQKDSTTGYLYVDYLGMVPLAVDAINQLQQKVDEQTAYIDTLKIRLASIERIINLKKESPSVDYQNGIASAILNPNVPNPFKLETKISFFLPESIRDASLYVYNLQGKQIKSFNIIERNHSFVKINAHELDAGLYIYTLIADGKEVGSYKMILTK